jgi:hypothetical protein
MPVPCAVCNRWLKRYDEYDQSVAEYPPIFTRTMVMGIFAPSCSEQCAAILRGRKEAEQAVAGASDENPRKRCRK